MLDIPVPAIIVKLRVARFLELRVGGSEVPLDFLGQRAALECGEVLSWTDIVLPVSRTATHSFPIYSATS